jgi:serine/threonine-protein kinase
VDSIAAKLATGDASIQREAVEALGALVDPQKINAVTQRLRDLHALNADVRDAASRVAGELARRNRTRGAPVSALSADMTRVAPMPTVVARADESGPVRPDSLRLDLEVEPPTLEVPTGRMGTAPPAPATREPAAAPPVVGPEATELDIERLEPDQMLAGRYRMIREIGRGGFGTVLRVEDTMVGEEIALKIINPQLVQDESAITRFLHEVRYARKITHENVIRIHDFLMLGKSYAMSMEYFASHPLSRRMRRGLHTQPALAVRFVSDICRGVQVAHQADIMHRDLKPANILVNDQDVLKIVDFGLAAAVSNVDSRVTKTGSLVGTPTYMSPEQARGLDIDARTDIYSLGVIMYEIFTGVAPYVGDNPLAVLYQHVEGLRVLPRARNAAIPEALEAVIVKAMAVDANARYQTAAEMLADLERLQFREAA